MPQLTTLILKFNNFSILEPNIFLCLGNLRKLDLNYNYFSSSRYFCWFRNFIKTCSWLEILLTVIEQGIYQHISAIHWLDLCSNRVKVLGPKSFATFFSHSLHYIIYVPVYQRVKTGIFELIFHIYYGRLSRQGDLIIIFFNFILAITTI